MHAAPSTRWRAGPLVEAVLAVCWILVPLWVAFTRVDALRAGHPLYPALLVVSAVVGALLLAWAIRRSRRPRRVGRVLAALVLVVAVLGTIAGPGFLAFLGPRTAMPVALGAMAGSAEVAVSSDARGITLTPRAPDERGDVGLIFQPGALVEARGYAHILSAIAARGHTVVIVRQPVGLGLAALGAEQQIMDAHPEISRWVVAGHSLGGVAASQAASTGDPRIGGLVLWAAYPDGATTVPPEVPVSVLYGTRDLLVERSDVEAARPQLPQARFVPIEGVNHAMFGDYGTQSRDGEPTVDRETGQAHIVEATLAVLDEADDSEEPS